MAAPIYVAGMSTPVLGDTDDAVTLNLPCDILPNDLLIALAFCDAGFGETITAYAGLDNGISIASTSVGLRRGLCAGWMQATGYEASTSAPIFTINTTSSLGNVSGSVISIRGALTVSGIHSATAINFTSGSPRPSSFTTDDIDELAVCAIAYLNTDTISDIDTNGWIQGDAAQTIGGTSFDFQYLSVPAAQTISGGTATLGTAAQWASITFAVKALYPEGTDRNASIANIVAVG